MDFAPNGYQIATGAGDDTVRIWDLRALRTAYIIPAHKSSVSDVRFFRSAAELPFAPLDSQTGSHANGVGSAMDVDGDGVPNGKANGTAENGTNGASHDAEMPSDPHPFAPTSDNMRKSGLFLVTSGFDCHVRIWSADEWAMIRDLPTDAGKVMSVDVTRDGKFIASASYSRSFHLFGGDHSL